MSKKIPNKKPTHPSRRQVLRSAGLAIGAVATSHLGARSASAAGAIPIAR